ncbi:hypothetical protein D920_03012 [Enterococcus faecalis 13-SD-W-01]|nr:hypothetical protein D920_03012 [Enterococcus faecalis 13-SD-W-01]
MVDKKRRGQLIMEGAAAVLCLGVFCYSIYRSYSLLHLLSGKVFHSEKLLAEAAAWGFIAAVCLWGIYRAAKNGYRKFEGEGTAHFYRKRNQLFGTENQPISLHKSFRGIPEYLLGPDEWNYLGFDYQEKLLFLSKEETIQADTVLKIPFAAVEAYCVQKTARRTTNPSIAATYRWGAAIPKTANRKTGDICLEIYTQNEKLPALSVILAEIENESVIKKSDFNDIFEAFRLAGIGSLRN